MTDKAKLKDQLEQAAKRNPRVDLELLRRAQEERARIIVEPVTYNIKPAFSRRYSD